MPQMLNHVDHVAYMCRPENHDAYVDKLEQLFKFEFEAHHEVPGLRFTWSWSTGLEILSPIGVDEPAAKAARDFLELRGEGVYGVVVGVANLEAALSHARSLGYSPGALLTLDIDAPWREQLDFQQCVIERFLGSHLLAGEIKYPA
jgi:4-hydroxyphenylpyruvate dioxygenase-like putative hemolysin